MKKPKLLNEFKEFATKGNVIDMAVGVIIGGAFGKIVTSLVNDIIMPALGLILGRVSLADLAATIPATGQDGLPIVIRYGLFLQTVLDFMIVAFSIFLFIKAFSVFKQKMEERKKVEEESPAEAPEPEAAPPPSEEVVLLSEIRDLLKRQSE